MAAAILLSLLTVAGCDAELDTDRAAALLQSRRAHFGSFDRWVRRTCGAEPAMRRRRRQLEGMLFAPVRHDSVVVAAWVRREGARSFSLRGGTGWPEDANWVRLRDERLGTLRVAVCELRDLRAQRGARVEAVLISRSATGPAGKEVQVVVAYAGDGATAGGE